MQHLRTQISPPDEGLLSDDSVGASDRTFSSAHGLHASESSQIDHHPNQRKRISVGPAADSEGDADEWDDWDAPEAPDIDPPWEVWDPEDDEPAEPEEGDFWPDPPWDE